MCGIAGIMYKGSAQTFDTGEALMANPEVRRSFLGG